MRTEKPKPTKMEATIYKEHEQREWTGRYILDIDGEEVGTFQDMAAVKRRIAFERKARRLRLKDVGVSTVFQQRRKRGNTGT